MLAKSTDRMPAGGEWAFEIKWDGVRAFAVLAGGRTRIVARRGEDITPRYPEIANLAEDLGGRDAVFDGEIVAFEDGRPSFQRLQKRMGLTSKLMIQRRVQEVPVCFVAFDLLSLDGEPLVNEPYERRRELLLGLGIDLPHWTVPKHHIGDGAALLDATRRQGLEGIVAKRIDSPYVPGKRTGDWLKIRNRHRQEFVIGGWMPGEGLRAGRVGSLLLGYWDATPAEARKLGRDQRLVYCGGVGTGFTQEILGNLTDLLAPLRRETPPFELGEDPTLKYKARARTRGGGPVWVEPEWVCEVEFSEWTHEGTLRQPSFKGLRDDKDPRDVIREPSAGSDPL
jgi:bifunctional non-homologous end joining protein LigD